MQATQSLHSEELFEFLLNVAPVRPVFIWGPPGIGKSSLVELFAAEVGIDCVSLLGSQLAPEDIIGVPQIVDGKSRFCPPTLIAREEPFCLFLDELNACSQEVQKAFYSLINDRRIGEFELPEGSIVIGAGNRAEDAAIVKPLSSALINRMVHVSLRANHRNWLKWANNNALHLLVVQYIQLRPDHLWSKPPKHEEPFSTPRSWHMLSDSLKSYSEASLNAETINYLAYGLLTPHHARQFVGFYKQQQYGLGIEEIIHGDKKWPRKPKERDILYFLVQSFRLYLIKNLSHDQNSVSQQDLTEKAKKRITELAHISLEMAQLVLVEDEDEYREGIKTALPNWFIAEITRSAPRLLQRKQ